MSKLRELYAKDINREIQGVIKVDDETFIKQELEEYLAKSGDLRSLAIMIGAAGVAQIQEAFDTSGFGEWAANSPFTIADKGSSMPLIGRGRDNDPSGHLRSKITYEVSENG